jgi:hypothetical protein
MARLILSRVVDPDRAMEPGIVPVRLQGRMNSLQQLHKVRLRGMPFT